MKINFFGWFSAKQEEPVPQIKGTHVCLEIGTSNYTCAKTGRYYISTRYTIPTVGSVPEKSTVKVYEVEYIYWDKIQTNWYDEDKLFEIHVET